MSLGLAKSARGTSINLLPFPFTGEKPFSCSSCQRGYSSRVNLQRHQQREHGDKQKEDKAEQKTQQEKQQQSATEEAKTKPVTRRPRREKLQEKIAAQEKLLNELKRSLSTLGDINEESPETEDKHAMPADVPSCAQVSVTVSMQVEPAKAAGVDDDDDEGITPEKENALSSSSTAEGVSSSGKAKSSRKITSYFTVVGQHAEL